MPLKIAINGFGRIGRTFFRVAFAKPDIEIAALNDLGDLENLSYLLQCDSVYGQYGKTVNSQLSSIKIGQTHSQGELLIDNQKVLVFQERDPSRLPWKELNIDVVVESTGVFTDYQKAKAHIQAGAKRVVISAPGKGQGGKQVLVGVNDEEFNKGLPPVTSNASCTTNAAAPVIKILEEKLGIKKALLNTVHAYTATQRVVDGPSDRDFRRGRAAAQNIVPSTTGAAKAVSRSIASVQDKFDGIALRVPVICGSIADITFLSTQTTNAQQVNNIMRRAAKEPRWQGILRVSEKPLVSTDIIKDPHAAIVDLSFTRVIGGDLVKMMIWYDNEWGYCVSLLEHVLRVGRLS